MIIIDKDSLTDFKTGFNVGRENCTVSIQSFLGQSLTVDNDYVFDEESQAVDFLNRVIKFYLKDVQEDRVIEVGSPIKSNEIWPEESQYKEHVKIKDDQYAPVSEWVTYRHVKDGEEVEARPYILGESLKDVAVARYVDPKKEKSFIVRRKDCFGTSWLMSGNEFRKWYNIDKEIDEKELIVLNNEELEKFIEACFKEQVPGVFFPSDFSVYRENVLKVLENMGKM